MFHDDQGYMLTISTLNEYIRQNYPAMIVSQNFIPLRVATTLNTPTCIH